MLRDGYRASTAGERLFQFIDHDLLGHKCEHEASELQALRIGGRANDLGPFFHGFSCANILVRLLKKTERTLEVEPSDPAKTITQYIEKHLEVAERHIAKRLAALAIDASRNSSKSIPRSVEQAVLRGRTAHHCYLCGNSISKNTTTTGQRLELEHIWPSSYGGDSVAENLLPTCDICNRSKGDMILWHTAHLASFCLKPTPSTQEQASVQRREKIAWFMKLVHQTAKHEKITLKEAALNLGPIDMQNQKSIYEEDSRDFFNLTFEKN